MHAGMIRHSSLTLSCQNSIDGSKVGWDARNETSVEGPLTINYDNNGIWHLAVNYLSQ
jgi:hypothetical protein